MPRSLVVLALSLVAGTLVVPRQALSSEEPERCNIWVDLYSGEPIRYEKMLDDLMLARVIYLGERHTLIRHHDSQERIIRDLAARGVKLAVGLEMLPAEVQPTVDQYNTGQLDFDGLAGELGWADRWENYQQYRGAIEAGRESGAPILALNAESELVSAVAGNGFAGLDAEQMRQLPGDMNTDQPDYQRELSRVMMVMAHVTGEPDMLRRMFQAQITRDEAMARAIATFLRSSAGQSRTVVVLCGSGHVSYGYGIPSRVRARVAGIADRIVVFSESGDVVLSEREKAMARAIEITHAQLRDNKIPYADYLQVRALAPETPAEPETLDPGTGAPEE